MSELRSSTAVNALRALVTDESAVPKRLSAANLRIAVRLENTLRALLKDSSPLADFRNVLDQLCVTTLGEPLNALAARSAEPVLPRAVGNPQPIDRVSDALRLSSLEIELLLLAGLADEHEAFSSLLRMLHVRAEPACSVALAGHVVCSSVLERLSLRNLLEAGALARSGALRLAGEGPFFERSLELAPCLGSALRGIDVWPAGVQQLREPVALVGLEAWLESRPALQARAALRSREPRIVLVTSEDEELANSRAAALAAAAGVPFAQLLLRECNLELERLVSLHALARGVVPIVRSAARSDDHSVPSLHDHPGAVIVCAHPGRAVISRVRPLLAVPADALTLGQRRSMWTRLLPELHAEAAELAARYTLDPAEAQRVSCDVRSRSALSGEPVTALELGASVRARCSLNDAHGVKLVQATAKFEHLVLRPNRRLQLQELLDRRLARERVLEDWGAQRGRPGARGLRALFSGPPGTGKTLSAEVLANALAVDLLIVDVSRVVSKWLGETEKNLSAAFDAAERTQAVLLFDEADALFGARTAVSDANDRYANLETAYLLSRLERFEGIAILTTNLRQNIDPAFLRRLEFLVDFEEPSALERKALWACHLPERAPLASDVDLTELAEFYPVVGGVIKNAAVAAAFLAAAENKPIARRHLVRAIWREYEKSGRAFPGLPAGMHVETVFGSARPQHEG